MRALTIWPEWAWAITALGKRIENRSWHPGARLSVGEQLAIHAGAHLGGGRAARDSVALLQEVARSAGYVIGSEGSYELFTRGGTSGVLFTPVCGAVVAVARLEEVIPPDARVDDPWAAPGCYRWLLGDVQVLPFSVPCKGAQGLWTVPPSVESYMSLHTSWDLGRETNIDRELAWRRKYMNAPLEE